MRNFIAEAIERETMKEDSKIKWYDKTDYDEDEEFYYDEDIERIGEDVH